MTAPVTARTPIERRLTSGQAYAEWEGEGQAILALHGATSTWRFWSRLAQNLPGRRIVAPDLRGRGASMSMGGPYGLHRHADDLLALIDELHLRDVLLVGHSLGAFIAPLLASRSRGPVTRMVLVDGGVEVALPFFMTRGIVRAVFRRQARQLSTPFATGTLMQRRDWQAMLGAHPDELVVVRDWLEAATVPAAGGVVSAVAPEALPDDSVSCFFDSDVRAAARNLACPAHLLYAEWGRGDGKRPFYAPRHIESLVSGTGNLTAERVPGANHVTILFAPQLVQAVARG